MKVVNVNLITSPTKVRLIINDNIKYEGDDLAIDALFTYIQSECQGTVNLNLHSEWTEDIDHFDESSNQVLTLKPEDAIVTEIGTPVDRNKEEDDQYE